MNGVPETLEATFGPTAAIDLALYAAASGDHNPLHLDADVARAAGFERPVVHGMLSMAYAARLFTAQFGVGSLQSLTTRFTGIALRGDRLLFNAKLEGREGGEGGEGQTATYSLQARTEQGGAVLSGTARVALSPSAPAEAAP